MNIYELYKLKAKHQRSYAVAVYEGSQRKYKPKALLNLEAAHLYPNGKGGANSPENLMIVPALINRRNGDALPYQHNGLAGIQASGEPYPMEGGMYEAMVERFGLSEVREALGRLRPTKRFRGNAGRNVSLKSLNREQPIMLLLRFELIRIKLRSDSSRITDLQRLANFEYPLYVELLAIVIFHAILAGDPDRLLARIKRILNPFNKRYSTERVFIIMFALTGKYLWRYFGLNIASRHEMVNFYNSFYSVKVLEECLFSDDTVYCYSYSGGNIRKEKTCFVVPANILKRLM